MKRLAVLLWMLAAPLWALDPSEMLADAELEARARALDHEIRCVMCQSEAVASSNAAWARDARRQIRELVAGGASDVEVKAWFRERYGDFVLMDPPKTGSTLLLWLAAPLMLVIAIGGAVIYVRGRAVSDAAPGALTDAEKARLREILDE